MYNITSCKSPREQQKHQPTSSTNVGRPSKRSRHASTLPVRGVDLSPCKPMRAFALSGGLRRTGGMCAVQTLSQPPLSPDGTTRVGQLSWHGWENPAIRCLLNPCLTVMADVGGKTIG